MAASSSGSPQPLRPRDAALDGLKTRLGELLRVARRRHQRQSAQHDDGDQHTSHAAVTSRTSFDAARAPITRRRGGARGRACHRARRSSPRRRPRARRNRSRRRARRRVDPRGPSIIAPEASKRAMRSVPLRAPRDDEAGAVARGVHVGVARGVGREPGERSARAVVADVDQPDVVRGAHVGRGERDPEAIGHRHDAAERGAVATGAVRAHLVRVELRGAVIEVHALARVAVRAAHGPEARVVVLEPHLHAVAAAPVPARRGGLARGSEHAELIAVVRDAVGPEAIDRVVRGPLAAREVEAPVADERTEPLVVRHVVRHLAEQALREALRAVVPDAHEVERVRAARDDHAVRVAARVEAPELTALDRDGRAEARAVARERLDGRA
jgi:hypothetical protein